MQLRRGTRFVGFSQTVLFSFLLLFFFGVALPCHIPLQDYGWIKQGMIFPFVDYLDR
jgi:hypothetical protein